MISVSAALGALRKLPAAALAAGCVLGCLDTRVANDTGTEIPNELVGQEIIAGNGPAVDAEIRLIPIGYVPGGTGIENSRLTSYTARTDSSGRFSLTGVVPGQYNVLAVKDGLKSLRDSVALADIRQDLGTDTLLTPGSLYGTIVLQPGQDPRSATVQVLGTNEFVNVDSAGGFLLRDLAPGRYRLRVETSLDGYTPLFASAEALSGRTDTLPPMRPFYALVPVVAGVEAYPLADGTVRISWDSTPYVNVDGYLIYRDSSGFLLPSTTPIARVENRFDYIDILYSDHPGKGQYPLSDSAIREITYRVRILDRNGVVGPAYAKATVIAYPPGKVGQSGRWRIAAKRAPFGPRGNPAVIGFAGRLWLIGGARKEGLYNHDIWSSPDGVEWTRELDSLPFAYDGCYKAAVFRSKLWILAWEDRKSPQPLLYSSEDGRRWAPAQGPDLGAPRFGTAFASYRDRLWIFDGSPDGGVFTSSDGMSWTRKVMPDGFRIGSDPAVAAGAEKMIVMGGRDSSESGGPSRIWTTLDGETWASAADGSGLLPRSGLRLAFMEGWYAIGGVRNRPGDPIDAQYLGDQVWFASAKASDKWDLDDAHAPFGKRDSPGVAEFNESIWVIGGMSAPDGPFLDDVWVKSRF